MWMEAVSHPCLYAIPYILDDVEVERAILSQDSLLFSFFSLSFNEKTVPNDIGCIFGAIVLQQN